jgi:hypothetical protein
MLKLFNTISLPNELSTFGEKSNEGIYKMKIDNNGETWNRFHSIFPDMKEVKIPLSFHNHNLWYKIKFKLSRCCI